MNPQSIHADLNLLMADMAHARLVKRTRALVKDALAALPRASRRAILIDMLLEVEPTKRELESWYPRDHQGPEPVIYESPRPVEPTPPRTWRDARTERLGRRANAAPEPPLERAEETGTTETPPDASEPVQGAPEREITKVVHGRFVPTDSTREFASRSRVCPECVDERDTVLGASQKASAEPCGRCGKLVRIAKLVRPAKG